MSPNACSHSHSRGTPGNGRSILIIVQMMETKLTLPKKLGEGVMEKNGKVFGSN
jgi:hypothetical protein